MSCTWNLKTHVNHMTCPNWTYFGYFISWADAGVLIWVLKYNPIYMLKSEMHEIWSINWQTYTLNDILWPALVYTNKLIQAPLHILKYVWDVCHMNRVPIQYFLTETYLQWFWFITMHHTTSESWSRKTYTDIIYRHRYGKEAVTDYMNRYGNENVYRKYLQIWRRIDM